MKKRIHVNQHNIKANAKDGGARPVITIKTYRDNTYAHSVEILGSSKIIYSPDKPLSCGAKVWIETEADIVIDPSAKRTKKSVSKRAERVCGLI